MLMGFPLLWYMETPIWSITTHVWAWNVFPLVSEYCHLGFYTELSCVVAEEYCCNNIALNKVILIFQYSCHCFSVIFFCCLPYINASTPIQNNSHKSDFKNGNTWQGLLVHYVACDWDIWGTISSHMTSAERTMLHVPPLMEARLAVARSKAFSVVVPLLWNSIQVEFRTLPSLLAIQQGPKKLFCVCFPILNIFQV